MVANSKPGQKAIPCCQSNTEDLEVRIISNSKIKRNNVTYECNGYKSVIQPPISGYNGSCIQTRNHKYRAQERWHDGASNYLRYARFRCQRLILLLWLASFKNKQEEKRATCGAISEPQRMPKEAEGIRTLRRGRMAV